MGGGGLAAVELGKPASRFCFSCSVQLQASPQRDRKYRIFSKPACASLELGCASAILISIFFEESNQIKSRKQNVSQSVSTALPLHVASGDLFFFVLTSKRGNIYLGNTLETENEG